MSFKLEPKKLGVFSNAGQEIAAWQKWREAPEKNAKEAQSFTANILKILASILKETEKGKRISF